MRICSCEKAHRPKISAMSSATSLQIDTDLSNCRRGADCVGCRLDEDWIARLLYPPQAWEHKHYMRGWTTAR